MKPKPRWRTRKTRPKLAFNPKRSDWPAKSFALFSVPPESRKLQWPVGATTDMLNSRRKSLALTCALFLLLLMPMAVRAQEHAASSNQTNTQKAPKPQAGENQVDQGTTGALAEASREAAGEDENNFNQYPSILFLARLLHIRPFV